MITFRIARHTVRPCDIVEVLYDGKMCATIIPAASNMVRVMSAHIVGAGKDTGIKQGISIQDHVGELSPIPTIDVVFDPRAYTIEGGRIIRA